ncbi:MAG TPA: hypothetical protein VN715_00160 [Roseiarcus sp.]|nr:hypothetical protein [Roseiarcus sp.]
MLDLLLTLVTGQIGANLRRIARLAAFAAATLIFAAIALAAAAAALFLTLDAALGPVSAALIVAVGAIGLAALASIPLWRKSAPPPPSAAATLAQLAIAVGLGMMAPRKEKNDSP